MINDSTNQKERQWTYIVFFLIGILSLPLGLIFGSLLANNIEGTWQLIFPLFICSILFAIAMYAFKVRSAAFALKALAISFGFLFLIYVSWFMWSANEHESGAISITKFDTPQGEYSELTAGELKEYPALEKALSDEGCTKINENNWYCKVGLDELKRTSDFVNKKKLMGAPLFKINEKYYKIGFMTP
ncbi:MAG: hypothetical protein FIB07_03175 [Candidatus Methanoperedens sp.]|nr:hypothetical protein [Candidatus Methanoperedens sp.]